MNTVSTMDDNLYLKIRRNVLFFYFGNKCLADYDQYTIAVLDDMDTDIIKYINGYRTVASIISLIISKYKSVLTDEVMRRMESLIKRGVIVARKEPVYSIAEFKGIYGKFYPKNILVELTNVCNFRCPFCYKNALNKGEFIDDQMIEDLIQIIGKQVPDILLTGGEPTLHPHLLKYIEGFTQCANVSMNTNGSKLYEFDGKVLSLLSHIQITLYGVNNDEYLKTTGICSGFEKVKRSVNYIRDLSIPHTVAVTLNRDNIDRIEEYVLATIDLGVERMLIGHVDEFGREASREERSDQYKKQIDILPRVIKQLKIKYHNKLNIVLSHGDYNLHSIDPDVFNNFLACGSGSETFAISQKGNVRVCECLPETIFDMGGLDVLKAFIDGDIQFIKLKNSVIQFCGCYEETNNLPCEALRKYYELHLK